MVEKCKIFYIKEASEPKVLAFFYAQFLLRKYREPNYSAY